MRGELYQKGKREKAKGKREKGKGKREDNQPHETFSLATASSHALVRLDCFDCVSDGRTSAIGAYR
jgi:hypothetical protein